MDNISEVATILKENEHLKSTCEQLRIQAETWETKYIKELEWFHQKIKEIEKLADERVLVKQKEITDLKNKNDDLQKDIEQLYAQNLNKMHDMQSVYDLQDVVLKKRTQLEQEAFERETRFNQEKTDWLKQMDDMKKRTIEVLQNFEQEYAQKKHIIEQEYAEKSDALTRKEELMQLKKDELEAHEKSFQKQKDDAAEKHKNFTEKIENELKKPKYDPKPNQIIPLVRESLDETMFPVLVKTVAAIVENAKESLMAKVPQKFHQEYQLQHDALIRTFHDIELMLKPITIALQMASVPLIVDEVLKKYEQIFAAKKIDIKKEYKDTIPHLMLDPQKTHDALRYIIENAVDSMPGGGVIKIMITHDVKTDTIKAAIEDKGNGILAENLPKIFNPFYTTKKGSWGLGLTLARSILNALNTAVLIESTPRTGTTVNCIFSLRKTS